jgi:hypothetical protein
LKQKDQKFKADIIGPNAQSGRFPAMSARPTRPTHSRFGVPIHGIRTRNSTATDKSPPFTLSGLDPPSLTPLEHTLAVASRHREEEQACHEQSAVEAIHFITDYM